ncbi:MAG: HYExAFE family protein [Sedimentisphaerales bacterium]|nr:HYExAFE family protein [Sedimentisphaerales bacterium]MBN2842409.1 HYExAFE family protein [Sedimentisphaerales bacterium]
MIAQNSRHYELAFESWLYGSELPFVPLSQVRQAIMHGQKLKSFDYIVHPDHGDALLVEIKGRKLKTADFIAHRPGENWVTHPDVDSMLKWQQIFGPGHSAVFVFVYWLFDYETQVPNTNPELFEHMERHYWFNMIYVNDYQSVMKTRSTRWHTVDLPAAKFRLLVKELGAYI